MRMPRLGAPVRGAVDEPRRANARCGRHAIEDPGDELDFPRRVDASGVADACRYSGTRFIRRRPAIAGGKAQVDAGGVDEAREHAARADEQHLRERQLADDQRLVPRRDPVIRPPPLALRVPLGFRRRQGFGGPP